jgi:KAP family P-loop domain
VVEAARPAGSGGLQAEKAPDAMTEAGIVTREAPLAESSAPIDLEESVFRAFEQGEFLEWPAWVRLRKILTANGGSYGISGPRGSGKSWLMLRAIEDVREQPDDAATKTGLGLWYPSPSEYDPLAFLASLSDSLANAIDRRYRDLYPARNPLGPFWSATILLLLAAAAAAVLTQFAWPWWGAHAAAGAAVLAAVGIFLFVRRRALHPERRLLREAALLRERARFTATRRESSEVGAEGGRGIVARFGMSRERELVERPATLSTLVNDFRALAEQAGVVAGRVVIAIDELDKMADPDRVRDLLRDIKGIFEVPQVHFLVSVSDEAARTLNLGALAGRNEFNSSFYTVIELPPTRPQECAELLQRRGRVPPDVAHALSVIAGGNPREVLRLAELVGPATTGQDAVVRALREETAALKRDIVTADGRETKDQDGNVALRAMAEEARVGAFNSVPDEAVESPASIVSISERALTDEFWQPTWIDDGWNDRFQESWRRLLVRLAVAGRLAGSQSIVRDTDLELLQGVIVAASQSSAIGKIVLESRLQIEARRPAVEQPTARTRLEELVKRFRSNAPTEELDTFFSEARVAAVDAQLEPREIDVYLASNVPGERAIGLAAVQATAIPEAFDRIIETVQKGPPLEQYHALSALESLRPGLSEEQRDETIAVLNATNPQLPADSARRALVERILAGIERDATPLAAS